MELKKILAVSGRPGLYQMIAQSPKGIVAESLTDGKKVTLFSHERISALEEISIFTHESDVNLKDVLRIVFQKLEGKPALSHKSSANELRTFMEEMLPNYDTDRVYNSDIQKLVNWYNLLTEKNLIDNEPDEEETQDAENQEEKHAVKEEIKTEKKPKPQRKSPTAKAQKSTATATPKPAQRKTSPRAK
jgi:cobalamin-dependent methionine synthase I